MRSVFKVLAFAMLVAVVATGIALSPAAQQLAALTDFLQLHPGATLLLAGVPIMAIPKSIETLIQQSTASGALEAIPWCFYDTQTYVDNVTVNLPFFAAVNADKTMCNLEAPAAIPAPNFFEVVAFTIDFLFTGPSNAAAAVTGVLNDLALLLNSGRAMFTFTMNQKPYVRVPVRAVGSSGGVVGFLQGSSAATNVAEYATSSVPGVNPYRVEKAITLAPNNNFSAQIDVAAAVDLSANVNICVGMWGVYHRKVV